MPPSHDAASTMKRASLLPQNASSSTSSLVCAACCPCRPSSATATCGVAFAATTQQQQQQRQKENTTVLCASCVHRFVQAARQRHQAVVEEHAVLQRACRETFAAPPPVGQQQQQQQQHHPNDNHCSTDAAKTTVHVAAAYNRLWQLQHEEWQQTWLPRWELLRRASSHISVQVARKTCENEQRRQALQEMANDNERRRQLLMRWKRALLQTTAPIADPGLDEKKEEPKDQGEEGASNVVVHHVNRSENALGAMVVAVTEVQQQVRRLRFQWAMYAFQLHKLNVGDDHHHHQQHPAATTTRDAVCRGIGKIGGCLPLPHAGPELYVFLPPPELQSALRLVASLTSLVAACLGILLPHPILLQQQQQQQQQQAALHHDSSTTTKSATGGGVYSVSNNATPSMTTMARKTHGFEYCRDLAMRGTVRAVEQPSEYYSCDHHHHHHHHEKDGDYWQEQAFQNAANASSSTTTTKAAAPTLSTSYLVSLAGQTFRRATGVGGTPTATGAAALTMASATSSPATRTVPSSSSNGTTARITTTPATTTRRQHEIGSSKIYNIPPPSMDPASVERRIHHATAAVLAENEQGSLYTLAAPGTIISSSLSSTGLERRPSDEIASIDDSAKTNSSNNSSTVVDADHFAIALQLLQNNVICLCIRAGVPVTNLWPAQAVLLNLQALQEFCQEQAATLSPILVHRR